MPKIEAPGGFVPQQAMAYGASGAAAVSVDGDHPLPVAIATPSASSTPVAGTASASTTVGPFTPQLGRAIWISLSGAWAGSAQLLRSRDGGASKLPLTIGGQPWASFTANANEAIGEEHVAGSTYHLAITLSSGSLTYRVEQ